MPETMINKDKNGENVSCFTEVVLVHCNIVNNDYQCNSRILYTFIPDILLDISPKRFIFLKTLKYD